MPTAHDGPTIVYEQPTAADAGSVGELFHEDMRDLGVETTGEDMHELAARVIAASRAAEAECLCRIAREDHTKMVCGVVLANINWSLEFGGRSLWIEELYVTPAYRRQGIGRQLVESVVTYAGDHGLRGIDLEAYQGNTPASVLYRTMGFNRLGRERFYYRVGTRDLS